MASQHIWTLLWKSFTCTWAKIEQNWCFEKRWFEKWLCGQFFFFSHIMKVNGVLSCFDPSVH